MQIDAPGPVVQLRHARLYLPDSNLQGDEIPCHLLWKDGVVRSIRLGLPEGVDLEDAFNVEVDRLDDGGITLRDFHLDGYVGWTLRLAHLDSPVARLPVEVVVEYRNGATEEIQREICSFRPRIEARWHAEATTTSSRPLLNLSNVGEGTSFIQVVVRDQPGASLEQPASLLEFLEAFKTDLMARLEALKAVHATHASLLQRLPPFLAAGTMIDLQGGMDEARQYFEELGEAAEYDRHFGDDLGDAFLGAFNDNLKVSNYFAQFVSLFQSLPGHRMILLNPLDELIIPEGSGSVDVEVWAYDRALGEPEVVDVPTLVRAPGVACRIPVHELVEVSHG